MHEFADSNAALTIKHTRDWKAALRLRTLIPVLCSRWVGSTGSATSSSGGDFDQLVGTRMYRECMGETGTGLPVRQPQPSSAEQQYRGSCSSTAAGGLVTSCQDTDTPSTPALVLPRAA